jgi:hypothetical protein
MNDDYHRSGIAVRHIWVKRNEVLHILSKFELENLFGHSGHLWDKSVTNVGRSQRVIAKDWIRPAFIKVPVNPQRPLHGPLYKTCVRITQSSQRPRPTRNASKGVGLSRDSSVGNRRDQQRTSDD